MPALPPPENRRRHIAQKNFLEVVMKKSVLITGGTVGTGYTTAEKFAQAGYDVFIASRSQERAQEAADKMQPIKWYAPLE